MSNLVKITGEDIIDSGAFSSGTYHVANKAAIESVGDIDAIASTLVKRTAAGGIICAEIDSGNISMDETTLGFFGGSPVTKPVTIDAPEVLIEEDNDLDDAILELQEKVGEIITALKDVGLIAT